MTPLGYDASFLSAAVPLPAAARDLRRLDYVHFTVQLDPGRRLAAATAVNIDGHLLRDVARGDDWHLDPRLLAAEQAGEELYTGNNLDRGHLVRRRDPVWGDAATAERANSDTFAYTNAAPQASGFNQGKELWVGLEDHVLEYAKAHHHRISVFTGPVLAARDPVYRGVAIPRLFWKVAAWMAVVADEPMLRSTGFVLDQAPALGDLGLPVRAEAPPPLEPFRTFQVAVAEIAELTALDLSVLAAADILTPTIGARDRSHWVALRGPNDIRW